MLPKSVSITAGPETGPGIMPAEPAVSVAPPVPIAPAAPCYGAVVEPVTMLWSNPGQLRDYDRSILCKPGQPAAWAAGMDTQMRLWLVGKTETQALYGEPVVILERRGDWLKVAAVAQKTKFNACGYPGWVPASHVDAVPVFLAELASLPVAVAKKPFIKLFANRGLTALAAELCYQTRLPVLEEKPGIVGVRQPDGNIGYLSRQDVMLVSELTFSRDRIVQEAKRFLGLRYVWGGTSPYGFDCSGLTMRLYQAQGIMIPRDAGEQAEAGHPADKTALLPGDLLFFAARERADHIHHVAMYIGNGMMIHSPNSNASVRQDAVDSSAYRKEYWGARRYDP